MRTIIRSNPGRTGWVLGITTLFTLLLIACGESAVATPTPTDTPTAPASAETSQPTATPTLTTPASAETSQPIATLTLTAPASTGTPRPVPTSTPTAAASGNTPQPDPTPKPTPAASGTTPQPDPTPTPTSPPSGTTPQPTTTTVPTVPSSVETPQPIPTPTSRPTEPAPSPSPTVTPTSEPQVQREIGQIDGVTFVVGEGSESTFTVEEKLARLPLPSDAVVRTTALSGKVHLDGRPSVIEIDLHQLNSDQFRRDSYIRDRMFPNDPIATFTLVEARPMPDGFTEGEEVSTQVTGQFEIRGVQVPLIFEVEARDDGDVIFILGRTTFVWDDFGLAVPNIGTLIQVTDEVSVEILLAVRPE